ncbi:putative aminodeoxychorismate lyase [Peptococcaceae bacterium CEB3]|nr:putative aminodeoxychorismate lyase [Peptococcaceae bacterium CEB3]
MGRRSKKNRVTIPGLILILGIIGALAWWNWASVPYATSASTKVLVVAPGATADEVGRELASQHLIRSAWVFSRLAVTEKVDEKLKPGEYYISAALSPEEIISLLLKGPNVGLVRVTVPEGYTTKQIISLLAARGLGTQQSFESVVEKDPFPYAFLQGAPAGPFRLEGFLFPDTYLFKKGTSPHDIINTFLQRFSRELTPSAETELRKEGLSVHDWVTLSSIVEAEAQKEKDRPLIASVYFNRLKKHMKLEADATVQFALGKHKPVLYDKDLLTPSPYNTYLHYGLPVGPICNPGHASLDAVLHPAQTDYLFYVAKGDGYHVFARTFAQQLQNEKKYQ